MTRLQKSAEHNRRRAGRHDLARGLQRGNNLEELFQVNLNPVSFAPPGAKYACLQVAAPECMFSRSSVVVFRRAVRCLDGDFRVWPIDFQRPDMILAQCQRQDRSPRSAKDSGLIVADEW
jgi:hypothetical protein